MFHARRGTSYGRDVDSSHLQPPCRGSGPAAGAGPAVTQTQMERPVAASHASISAAALCTDSIRP